MEPQKITGIFKLKKHLGIEGVSLPVPIDFHGLKINPDTSEACLELPLPPEIKNPCEEEIKLLLEEKFDELTTSLALAGVGFDGELDEFYFPSGGCVKVRIIEPVKFDENVISSANEFLGKLNDLSPEIKEAIVRSMKWWRRGFVEDDPVDKFLNFYVAFEIIGKKISPSKERWIIESCQKLGLPPETFKYEGKSISEIRGEILHAGKKEAINLAEKYANKFGEEVLSALRILVNNPAAFLHPQSS